MTTPEKPNSDDKTEPGVERRKGGDRRESTGDRRGDKRVVTELEPRRQKPERRKN